jgi:hypothetical protein
MVPAARSLGDIELCLPEGEIPAAREALAELGFKPARGSDHILQAGEDVAVLHRHVPGLSTGDADDQSLIRLARIFSVEGLDDHSAPRTLNATEHLLFVAARWRKGGEDSASWILDAAKIISSPETIDWPRIPLLAERIGLAAATSALLEQLVRHDLAHLPKQPKANSAQVSAAPGN